MNADRINMKATEYLKAWDTSRKLFADRCRHPSIAHVALWIIEEGRGQIGAVSEDGERWIASRMAHGQPYAQKRFDNFVEALEFAALEGGANA